MKQGISLYPTLYLNYNLQCADSISLDMMIFNIVGYICYTHSILCQMFNLQVRDQYKDVFDGRLPLLSMADLFYSCHGLFLQVILFSQVIFGPQLWGFKSERRNFHISSFTKVLLLFGFSFLLFQYYNKKEFRELDLELNLSLIKMLTSLVKHIPQVQFNMKRRSMYGISKLQTYLDILGALFCLSEFRLENTLPLLEAIDSNRGKVGIALVTFLFNFIYIIQLSLYPRESPERKKTDEQIELV